MEYDEVLEHVGPYGRHQMLAWFLVTVLSNWPFAWQTFSMNFLGYEPEHRCRIPFEDFNDTSVGDVGNYSFSSIGKCSLFANDTAGNNYTTGCEYGWWYSHDPVSNSIVTQWDLVCDKNFLAETAQAIFSFGILLGDLLFGVLADRYGRRKIFFATLAGTAVLGSVAVFSPNVYIFLVFRFFLGTLTVGFWLTGYLLILEIFPPKQRTYFGILAAFGWNSGALTMALFGYLIRDWKTLQLVISLPALAGVLVWWFVPESVRWLLARGRQEEAQQLVYNMAKFNNKKLPEDFQLCVPISKKERSAGDASNNEEKTYTTFDLFRTPKIRLRIICCTVLWIVNTLVYYGISFSAPSINGDFYLNFFLLMVIEVPAVMLALILAWRIGRRMPLIVSGMLAGIACIVTPFIPTDTAAGLWSARILPALGKFWMNSSFTILVLYTTELFPTVLRSNAGGFSSLAGRLGGIAFPYINYLGKLDIGQVSKKLPFILYGGLAILGSLAAFPLPETKDAKLLEHVEDLEGSGTLEKHQGTRYGANETTKM